MFIGHYGVALAAKRAAPGVSLGTFILAAQLADLVWPLMLLTGLEQVRLEPGATAVTPLDFVSYPFTHSLLALVGWAALLAGGYLIAHRRGRGGPEAPGIRRGHSAAIVGAVVISHWVLDVLVHRPDLPLVPGLEPRVGLGLWNSLPATLTLEIAFLGIGTAAYLAATRAANSRGRWGLYALVALLGLIYAGNVFGPPPVDISVLPFMGLTLWLFVPFGYWVDRHRTPAVQPVIEDVAGDQASSRSVSASAVTGKARASSASSSM